MVIDGCVSDSESDTATDGEEELRALELRKQEVRLQPARLVHDTDTGSDTEVRPDTLPDLLSDQEPWAPDPSDKNPIQESSRQKSETFANQQPDGSCESVSARKEKSPLEKSKSFASGASRPSLRELDTGFSEKQGWLSNLQRSCTFTNGRDEVALRKDKINPLQKSKTFANEADNPTDFKSSAPFEQKLNMFGPSYLDKRRSSNLELLLLSDSGLTNPKKEVKREEDDGKFVDPVLVSRRESLRKTNILNPKTLEFQAKNVEEDTGRHRLSFLVVKEINSREPEPPSPVYSNKPIKTNKYLQQKYVPSKPVLPPKLSDDDDDVDDIFEDLARLSDEDHSAVAEQLFGEVTHAQHRPAPPQFQSNADNEIEDFFEELEEKAVVDEITSEDAEELLKMFENEGESRVASRESNWSHSSVSSPSLLPSVSIGSDVSDAFEQCFEHLKQELQNKESSAPMAQLPAPPQRPQRSKSRSSIKRDWFHTNGDSSSMNGGQDSCAQSEKHSSLPLSPQQPESPIPSWSCSKQNSLPRRKDESATVTAALKSLTLSTAVATPSSQSPLSSDPETPTPQKPLSLASLRKDALTGLFVPAKGKKHGSRSRKTSSEEKCIIS